MTDEFEARARELWEKYNSIESTRSDFTFQRLITTALREAFDAGKSAQGFPSEEEIRNAGWKFIVMRASAMNIEPPQSIGTFLDWLRAQAKPVKELELDIEKLMPSDDEKETGWREWCGLNIRSMETCQKKDFYGGIRFFINHLHKIKERLGGRV